MIDDIVLDCGVLYVHRVGNDVVRGKIMCSEGENARGNADETFVPETGRRRRRQGGPKNISSWYREVLGWSAGWGESGNRKYIIK
jgi:hypothetical protein